jgi:hypothetical protein
MILVATLSIYVLLLVFWIGSVIHWSLARPEAKS